MVLFHSAAGLVMTESVYKSSLTAANQTVDYESISFLYECLRANRFLSARIFLRANIENVVEILCGSGQLVSGRAPSGVSARIYIFGPSECI